MTDRVRTPAKINLTLRVLGKRPDGYHDIESLVAWIGLFDELCAEFTPTPPGSPLSAAVRCNDAGVPTDDSNLIIRAASRLAARFPHAAGTSANVLFHLDKRIPMGGGLGGGSSNAAGALRLLRDRWAPQLPDRALAEVGAEIGSDVPLFLGAPWSIIRGRGERVEPVSPSVSAWAVLWMPPIACHTAKVYAAWRPSDARKKVSADLANLINFDELISRASNDLEAAALRSHPALAAEVARVRSVFGHPLTMSGSGSAFFHLAPDEETARERCAALTRCTADRVLRVPLLGR